MLVERPADEAANTRSMNAEHQTYAMLRGIRMFADFDDDECNRLLAVMQPRQVGSGDTVFEQGATGDTLVVLTDGILRVEVADHHGVSATVATIGTGEVVGEMAVLDAAPRSASVIAATDCQFLELSRTGLEQLRTSCPSASAAIVGAVIANVTKRLRNVNKRIDKELDPDGAMRKRREKQAAADKKEAESEGFFSRLMKRFGR